MKDPYIYTTKGLAIAFIIGIMAEDFAIYTFYSHANPPEQKTPLMQVSTEPVQQPTTIYNHDVKG